MLGLNGFSAPGSVPAARNVTRPGDRSDVMAMSFSSSTVKSPPALPDKVTTSVRSVAEPSASTLTPFATIRDGPEILPD